jgi:hypothetical protein
MNAKDACKEIKRLKAKKFEDTIKQMVSAVVNNGGSRSFDWQLTTLYPYYGRIDFNTSHVKKLKALGFKVEDNSRQVISKVEQILKTPEICRFFKPDIPAVYEYVNHYETIPFITVSACCSKDKT